MRTLWTFGDSLTFGHGCRPDSPLNEYYYEYKKDEHDLIWPELLSIRLECELMNLGKGGASNDYILDTMIDNYHKIKENDIVIVNKTYSQRFDIPHEIHNQLYSVTGELSFGDKKLNGMVSGLMDSKEKIETVVNFVYYFSSSKLYEERQEKRFTFMKSIIKCEKYFECKTSDILSLKLENITSHTKKKIVDNHLSFNGHKQFANFIYSKLYPEDKVI